MKLVLWLLVAQGLLGAFDTLFYHEWRAHLPSHSSAAAPELKLHALRDFIYSIIFGTLPFYEWHGIWSLVLATLLLAEIVITLADFMIEDRVRKDLGGVYPGERATHAIMGIVYGAFLATLCPILVNWWNEPSTIMLSQVEVPSVVRYVLVLMAVGVFLSGLRDMLSAVGIPRASKT
jgi:hypothetical protein